MIRHGAIVLVAGLVITAPVPAVAGTRGWAKASGIGRTLLVGTALGVPAVQGDWRGDLEAGTSLLAAGGTTYVLKELIHERRPDGSDNRSFPSGHTSVSFAAAATLEKRYGWKAGLPALAVASFVGLARVQADKHYVHDVLAGAAIGSMSGLLLTSRKDDRVRLTPWSTHGGGGIDVAFRF
ncbi:phosphatase PAP2 family protein [Sphingomonas arantia]|uniref:Phosphatase PAP2 family protein n=1 Tax=Sphingomonas arantia TaxID=1460676 RepID=A0ABW4TVJ8_9SPHN